MNVSKKIEVSDFKKTIKKPSDLFLSFREKVKTSSAHPTNSPTIF